MRAHVLVVVVVVIVIITDFMFLISFDLAGGWTARTSVNQANAVMERESLVTRHIQFKGYSFDIHPRA